MILAKARANSKHKYMRAGEFRELEAKVERTTRQVLDINVQLSAMKKDHQQVLERRFVDIAKQLLDPEDFHDIMDLAKNPDEEEG